jgi:hypothetical protein
MTGLAVGEFWAGGSAPLPALTSPGMPPLNGSGLGASTGRPIPVAARPVLAAAGAVEAAPHAAVTVAVRIAVFAQKRGVRLLMRLPSCGFRVPFRRARWPACGRVAAIDLTAAAGSTR